MPGAWLQVGNGEFAFGVDATGLQTTGGNTISQWGWHSFPLPPGLDPEDLKLEKYDTYGREVGYPPMRHPEGYQFDWKKGRVLKNYALVYISSGSGQFESEASRSFAVQGGDAFIAFPGIRHRYRPVVKTG